MRFLRRALRRALARAGYRVARIPAQQIVPPGALAAQGIEAAGSHFPVLAAAVARTAGQGPVLPRRHGKGGVHSPDEQTPVFEEVGSGEHADSDEP